MKFQQLRNATAKIRYHNKTFLLDPWLKDYQDSELLKKKKEERRFIGLPVNPLPFPVEEIFEGVDFILLTHLHEDHFSVDYLPKEIPILVQNENDQKELEKLGFKNVMSFQEEPIRVGDIEIIRTVAFHGAEEAIRDKAGEASGYVLKAPGEITLYLAGDTVYNPEIQKNIERFDPDIIVCNGSDARITTGRLIMNEREILQMAQSNPEKEIIVSHMDGTSHSFLSRRELKETLEKMSLSDSVLVPEDGETIEIFSK